MMRKYIFIIIAVAMAMAVSLTANAQRPVNKALAPAGDAPIGISADPVKDFTQKLTTSNVSFDYKYEMKSEKLTVSGSGSIEMQGGCYRIEGDGMKIWCDGSSVWTLDEAANEAVIEPSDAANGFNADPILILANCDKLYTWNKNGQPTSFGNVSCWMYNLKPKDEADVEFDEVKLYLTKDALVGAVLKTDEASFTFTVSSFEYRGFDSSLSFAPEDFPADCIVTDLR
ncbi:MAG: outer membrane lipoprotein carrier protein LolA [Bacteroidales bacterium]|nr:outer membrane lipoprotein carrier protein LolA [Bacteroidales bacterium]